MALLLAALPMLFVLGCEFEALELEGRTCPCATGYVCNEFQRCELLSPLSMDAGLDTRRTDVGTADTQRDVARDGNVEERDAGADAADSAPRDIGSDTSTMDVAMDIVMEDVPPAPSGCSGHLASAFVCEDFESGLGAGWDNRGGTFIMDRPGRGEQSMRFESRDRLPKLLQFLTPPIRTGDTVYLHALVRLESLTGMPLDAVGLVQFAGTGSPQTNIVTRSDGTSGLWVNDSDHYVHGGTFPPGEWFCLTAEVELRSTASGLARVFANEVEVARVTDGLTGNSRDHFFIGIPFINGTATAIVDIDEVALSRSPLPCDL